MQEQALSEYSRYQVKLEAFMEDVPNTQVFVTKA